MNLQVIHSINGKAEYVLLPVSVYHSLRKEINQKLREVSIEIDYVPFEPEDYVDNPITLLRIKAGMTQKELAEKMKVSQAYVSKLERQNTVSLKVIEKIKKTVI